MFHGRPCWFELNAAQGTLPAAEAFYAGIFGWDYEDAGTPGVAYRLASHGGDRVSGAREMGAGESCGPPGWMIYIAVDDTDTAAARIASLGGAVLRPPADIPGIGRFAIAADPQGAAFGILTPAPMEPAPAPDAGAWNQQKESHGNWIELMSTDPAAGLGFYAALFGWTRAQAFDMGEMGSYQLFSWQGTEIGGMMGLGFTQQPGWLPYFGVNGINAAIARVDAGGGKIVHGPVEVPGPAFIAIARDPQGVPFAMVGPGGDA